MVEILVMTNSFWGSVQNLLSRNRLNYYNFQVPKVITMLTLTAVQKCIVII